MTPAHSSEFAKLARLDDVNRTVKAASATNFTSLSLFVPQGLHSAVLNARWPIYYQRRISADKQIPSNEVIWPRHVYANIAEGFDGQGFPVRTFRAPSQSSFVFPNMKELRRQSDKVAMT